MRFFFILSLGICLASSAGAMDYVQLKNGRLMQGAILRQDTTAVYMTSWDHRQEKFPPLEVFGRHEIAAIWFDTPPANVGMMRRYYKPRNGRFEVGGGAIFQSWQTSDQPRRDLLQISTFGAFSISRVLGVEADIDITYPFGNKHNASWAALDLSHQVTVNIVGHLPLKSRFVPYGLVGGGSAEGIPLSGVILTDKNDLRSLIQVGAGVKYGFDGFGMRLELRHAYYIWSEDQLVLDAQTFGPAIRRVNLDADATFLRFTIFGYF